MAARFCAARGFETIAACLMDMGGALRLVIDPGQFRFMIGLQYGS